MNMEEQEFRVALGYVVNLGSGRSGQSYKGGEVFTSGPIQTGTRKNGDGEDVPVYTTVEELYAGRVQKKTKKLDSDKKPIWRTVIDPGPAQRSKEQAPVRATRAKALLERGEKLRADRDSRNAEKDARTQHRMETSPRG